MSRNYLSLSKRNIKMNRHKLILLLSIFVSMFFLACSEPTIQEDAQKAADLSRSSNTAAKENDLGTAGKLYNEAQVIMDKYRQNGRFDEFYQLYSGFLQEGAALENHQSTPTPTDPVSSTPVSPDSKPMPTPNK